LGCPTRSRALRFTALVTENAGFFFLAISIVPQFCCVEYFPGCGTKANSGALLRHLAS
jgi:hypothetical protein